MLVLCYLLGVLLLISICKSSTSFTVSSAKTSDSYRRCSVAWGTPKQSFNVLIDSTSNISWIFGSSAGASKYFDISASSTYNQLDGNFEFEYLNTTTTIKTATDNFTFNSVSYPNLEFALASDDIQVFDDESIYGVLALNRNNDIMGALIAKDTILENSVTFDLYSNKIHFGDYTPSSSDIVNQTNVSCVSHLSEQLNNHWSFQSLFTINGISFITPGEAQCVIDVGSPYITIYAKTSADFTLFWENMGASDCNSTSRYCSSTSDLKDYISFEGVNSNWTIIVPKADLLDGKYLQIFYGGDGANEGFFDSPNANSRFVFFLGEPVLKSVVAKLTQNSNPEDGKIMFYYTDHSTSTDWITIVIVFAAVLAFTILFFGLYFWKHGKIPPHTNHDVEEQVSLLRGPLQPSQQHTQPPPRPQNFGGVGNDFGVPPPQQAAQNNDNQLQQAQRQQPQRQPSPPRPQPAPQQRPSGRQQIGSGSGQARPDNPDELRLRRLKFLEEQQKKQEEQQNDDNN